MSVEEADNCVLPRVFPADLERIIFEIAAYSCPTEIPTYMLTAWRVKVWLEPVLYRVVYISATSTGVMCGVPVVPADVLLRAIIHKQSSLLQAVQYFFVHDMHMSPESAILDAFLSACPCITHLFSTYPLSSSLQALASLHCLRDLTIDATKLFPSRPLDFGQPLFRNVTHLELLDIPPQPVDAAPYGGLVLMSNLTHISFCSMQLFFEAYPRLVEVAHLRCIVLLSPLFHQEQSTLPLVHPDDDRFVNVGQTDFQSDWFRSTQGSGDYWLVAETFIAAKRAGDVPREYKCLLCLVNSRLFHDSGSMYSISDMDKRWRS
ncbi:hypothetical protein C8R45DRAFT_985341 [Mycena sanguinolenta]|nr:hypothetical protein C8R45DRAFT_985341 [Mycena sanguinolenta]